MSTFQIRPVNEKDRAWIVPLLTEWWGSPRIVTRGKLFQADELPGFVAMQDDKPAGLVTYLIKGRECEIGSINSMVDRLGIGTALIDAVKKEAMAARCRRVWLITTNDNTQALRFWQRHGFVLVAVYPNTIQKSRKLKPEIPLLGEDGIPIRDEIELETLL